MNTYRLVINGYTRNMTATETDLVNVLSSYTSHEGTLRTRQYGEVTPSQLVSSLCAHPMGGTGRTVDIFNAPICALGGDFGTVTVS